ncbi:phosphoribosylglycinamide formyltransferase [Dermabacteraceae bacterium P7074]
MTVTRTPVVVFISGSGSNLHALLEDSRKPDCPFRVCAVVADVAAPGLSHAEAHGIPHHVVRLADFPDREAWNRELARVATSYAPTYLVLAGFMRLLGAPVLEAFPDKIINTHPALLPSFPGPHGVRDALAYGVKVSGVSVIMVDAGVDTGRIIAQEAITVADDDTVETLHERIKERERPLLISVLRSLCEQGVPTAS